MNEEQVEELEALESIYPDILDTHSSTSFDINIQVGSHGVKLGVIFPETYPHESPHISVKPISAFDQEDLKAHVNEIIERGIGSAMMFDIIEGIKEWLENLPEPVPESETVVQEEETKKVYSSYTPVTLETFTEWKAKFDQEMKATKEDHNDKIKLQEYINGLTYQEVWSKPTGRELFEGQNIQEIDEEEEEKIMD